MYIPKDIENIIFSYVHNLKFKKVMKELKTKINYIYISPFFSEIQYFRKNAKITTYYYSSYNLLIMHKNDIINNYVINKDTNIMIINYI